MQAAPLAEDPKLFFFNPDPNFFLWVLDPDLAPDPNWLVNRSESRSGSNPKNSIFHYANDFSWLLRHTFQHKYYINVFLIHNDQIANFYDSCLGSSPIPEPDPAKRFGSLWIRINNTEKNLLKLAALFAYAYAVTGNNSQSFLCIFLPRWLSLILYF
jgi:hypothetical protein